MANAIAVRVSVTPTGRGRTVTAPPARTPACPAWVCCAAGGASVCVAAVSAPSPGPTAPPVRSAPPAPTPAP